MNPGDTFGYWTVVEKTERRTKSGNYYWLCRCKCGRTSEILPAKLTGGYTSKCVGCSAKERTPHLKHGHSKAGEESATYKTWASIISRCTNTKNRVYGYYGGAGVHVCQHWRTFANFLSDMGERPADCVIDRLNDSKATKHYSCGHCPECKRKHWKFHCRWVSRSDSNANRAGFCRNITHNGKTQTIAAWARELGIPYTTIVGRLNRGWSPGQALQL